jgi:aminoglycoside phosphotransferase (APT) family kinase protein
MSLHEGEVPIDVDLVRRLVAQQFPALAGLTVRAFSSTGTVNAVFRLGPELYARLPRLASWAEDLEREQRWLPRLAPYLPLAVPEAVEQGAPALGYPLPWAIFRWIEGSPYDDELVEDEVRAAESLAAFVRSLRGVEVSAQAPPAGRGPLSRLDVATRSALDASAGRIDLTKAQAAWVRALDAPPFTGPPTWIHTDLLRPNLLVRDGRLAAVIDFGTIGVGDPAADVIPAWTVFGPAGRSAYRRALEVDEGSWERARGYALTQAALIVPYYRDTNPGFVDLAVRTIEQILAELDASGWA